MADAASPVIDLSADFPDLASVIFIVEGEIFKREEPWDQTDLESNDDREPSALQRVQELFRTYGLSVFLISSPSKRFSRTRW